MINGHFILWEYLVLVDGAWRMYEYPFDEGYAIFDTHSAICPRDLLGRNPIVIID